MRIVPGIIHMPVVPGTMLSLELLVYAGFDIIGKREFQGQKRVQHLQHNISGSC